MTTLPAVIEQLDIAWVAIEAARQVLLLESEETPQTIAAALLAVRDSIDEVKRTAKVLR